MSGRALPQFPSRLVSAATLSMNLEMPAIKHNTSPTVEDPSHAGGEFGRKRPKRETESAQDMVHEVEIGNQGNCCTDGSLMTSRVHNRRKQEPYFTDTGTGTSKRRRTD